MAWGVVSLVFDRFYSSSLRKRLEVKGVKEKILTLDPAGRSMLAGALIGAFIMALLAWNTRWVTTATVVGGLAGYAVVRLFLKMRSEAGVQAKRREITLFFEAVEMYLRARLSMPYALSSAKLVAPSLAKAVNTCLGLWPSGSTRALEALRNEINLPEADIVVSLLIQIDRVGVDSLQGVIQREAQNLERLREAAARTRIITSPVYFVVYRLLPLLSVFGMFAGALYWRLAHMLKGVGLGF
jgi:hypothetical protein